MYFDFSEPYILAKRMFHDFAQAEIKPLAAEIDEDERFPIESLPKLATYGFLGIPFPKEYGGQGADNLLYATAVEELSKVCATTGVIVSAHTSLCAAPIFENGTQTQKEKYLLPLAKGEKLGAFGLTEPNAGTDAAAQQTIAEKKDDYYLLNGSKIFITNADFADTYIIMAMTDKKAGTRGISAFILEKGMPGFNIGKKEKKLGIRGSSTCELIFENVKIPLENLLGIEGRGFGIAMKTLDGGRIGIAAQALGIAQGAIEEAIRYTKERRQFGQSIASFQNTQFQLANMQTKIDAARWLVYHAAWLKDQKKTHSKEAAMAKLFASETAMEVTTKAVQLFGGYGYSRDYPVERMMRDAKITEIYEGTSEVQKMVIGGSIIK